MDDSLKALLYLVGGAIVLVGGMKLAMALGDRSDYYPGPDPPVGCRNVALFGDSFSGGLMYRQELEELLGPCNVVRAFAHVGQGTGVIRSHLAEVLAWGPTDIVVLVGVNDLASGRSADLIINNLEWIYQTAQNYGVRVIAVTIIPWGGHAKGAKLRKKTQVVNDWISWESPADVIIDTSTMGDGSGVAYDWLVGSDGLHLTETGQIALATAVYSRAFG